MLNLFTRGELNSVLVRTTLLIMEIFDAEDVQIYLDPQVLQIQELNENYLRYPIRNRFGDEIGAITFKHNTLSEKHTTISKSLLEGMVDHLESIEHRNILKLKENRFDDAWFARTGELEHLYADLNLAHEELNAIFNSMEPLYETVREINDQMRSFFDLAPIAFGILKDRNLKIEVANQLILKVWGKSDHVIGKTLSQALPELSNQPYLKILSEIFDSGERYVGKEASVILERNGLLGTAFFNFIYEPIKGANGDVRGIMILANEITDLVNLRSGPEKPGTADLK